MNKQVHLTTALVLGVAMLSIPTLATAVTTINVVDPATVIAKGAGAIVSVEFTCELDPSVVTFVNVELTQRTGNRTTSGFGSLGRFPITCDNMPQIVDVLVSAFGRVFKKGSAAIARVSAEVCTEDFFQCDFLQVAEVILVRR